MNQTKRSPTKPKAYQYKFTKRPVFILLTVVIMIGLLIGSVIYLLSHYKPPKQPKPQTLKTATNLSIEALAEDQKIIHQTLTENTEEYQDNLDNSNNLENSDDENQPVSLEDVNNSKVSAVQSRQIPNTHQPNNQDSGILTDSSLFDHTPKSATDYQDYINHEAAQQADLIDAEISIAINQVRKLNEQKLSSLISEQSDATPTEQTPYNQDNPNSQD